LPCGIGLRFQHHEQVLARPPAVGWLEVHSENFFSDDRAPRETLQRVRERYPLSLHGVGLSLGSSDALDRAHLAKLKCLERETQPMLMSEHLAWASIDGVFLNDLLPLPYTEEALDLMVRRVSQVQQELGRQLLIENVSSYLQFTCSQMTEWEFLAALVRESGCAVLLDVNNLYVSAMNHGFDSQRYLAGLDPTSVREIHLAGHAVNRVGAREVRIDNHGSAVCEAVWALYASALERFHSASTLIEWDTEIPSLEVLVAEAHHADRIRQGHVVAA
jgi:uncharacterized protein (UPF0276 family)